VSHRKRPETDDDEGFRYFYGWAFFFAGAAFVTAMVAAVTNISLYVRRYSSINEMVLIIPGLDKQGHLDLSLHEEDEMHEPRQRPSRSHLSSPGSIVHSPTIIL
jgi:hypothetical protein